ncbi:MAG: TonB-dependent receptor [Steroidobacteraceae bacterium]
MAKVSWPARIARVMWCASLAALACHASRCQAQESQASQSSPSASAQQAQQAPVLGEVIVTATKRAQSAQDVPFQVVALDQQALTARGAGSVEQALGYVPAVSFTSNGTNSGTYTIRGISTGSSVANAQSPVALYIDDINILDPTYPKVTMNLRLFDVARVEVLEGPQGTLFGSGSLGGAIRVITNQPDLQSYEAETQETIEDTKGGQPSYDVNAMVNLPLVTDTLALRIVGYYQHDGGYVDNLRLNESDVNYASTQGGRVELKWDPLENLTVLGTVLAEDDTPHDSAYSFYDNHEYEWDGAVPNSNYSNTKIYSLKGEYDPGWATVTSITTYAVRRENAAADFTADAVALLGIDAPSPITDEGPSRTFSQELRLASRQDQRFRWLIGGIYLDNDRTVDENVLVPGSQAILGGTSDDISAADTLGRTREQALFGDLSYDILPRLTLTVGARRSDDRLVTRQSIGGSAQIPSNTYDVATESSTTPKYNLSYHVTPAVMIYTQAAEGYRIGQVNTITRDPISGQPIPPASAPDSLWNYELGEKSDLLDHRLLVNADVYYIDWRDIQLNELTLVSGINYIGNAGQADVRGMELEVEARPAAAWDLGGSFALTDARLETVNPTVAATPGDRLPGSAPLSADVFLQYTHPLVPGMSVFGRIDARYVGNEYSNLDNSTSITYGRYSELNFRGGLQWSRYSLTAFVDNATNGSGRVGAFDGFNVPVAIRQRPLTVGLTFDARL